MHRWLPANRLKLEVEGFLESRRLNGCEAITIEGYYRKKLRRFEEFVRYDGHKQITADTIRAFFGSLDGLKPNARATYYRSLNTFFNWLVWEKTVSANPVYEARIRVPAQKKVKRLPDPATVAQALVQLRRECYGTKDVVFDRLRDLAILHFVLETGVRRSELCRMSMGETDLDRARATIQGKTGDERVVHFPYSREALRFYHEERIRRFALPADDAPFWVNKWGHILTVDGVSQLFDRVRRRTGLQVTPHLVRAISATWAAAQMIEKGADRGTVQLMLEGQYGWKDPRTPRIYIDLASDEDLRRIVHEQFSPMNRLRIANRRGGRRPNRPQT